MLAACPQFALSYGWDFVWNPTQPGLWVVLKGSNAHAMEAFEHQRRGVNVKALQLGGASPTQGDRPVECLARTPVDLLSRMPGRCQQALDARPRTQQPARRRNSAACATATAAARSIS